MGRAIDVYEGECAGGTDPAFARFSFHRPPPALQPFLTDTFSYCVQNGCKGLHTYYRIPDGMTRLWLSVEGTNRIQGRIVGFTRAVVLISGAYGRTVPVPTQAAIEGVGCSFSAGAAACLIGEHAAQLVNRTVHPADLWGAAGRRLAEQVIEASDDRSRLDCLLHFFLARLSTAKRINLTAKHTADIIRASAGRLGIIAVADRCGFSMRHMHRCFVEQVGMPPKWFARVCRVRAVLGTLDHGDLRTLDWSAVAASYGYADQAHLIHDFHDVIGLTPERLRRALVGGQVALYNGVMTVSTSAGLQLGQ